MESIELTEHKLRMEESVAAAEYASPDFSIQGEVAEGWLPVLAIRGRIVGIGTEALSRHLCQNFVEMHGNLVLDLRECMAFSSIAIGVLAILGEQRQHHDGSLIMVGLNDDVKRMLLMMGMGNLFVFCKRMDDAFALAEKDRWLADPVGAEPQEER